MLQAASMGMFWVQHDTPAASVAPGRELEKAIHHQQQVQLDGEQDADGNNLRQKHGAAEWRPTHSMRTVSSMAEQQCTHADAGAQDTRAASGERTSATRGGTGGGETGGGERRERMGVTARIEVAMGEVRVGASRRTQQLRERMKWLGDEAKRWLWRDAG